jgi:hypothetical protein
MLADIPAVAYTASWSDLFNAAFTANFKIDFSTSSQTGRSPAPRRTTVDYVPSGHQFLSALLFVDERCGDGLPPRQRPDDAQGVMN